jgi:hypothetical protein
MLTRSKPRKNVTRADRCKMVLDFLTRHPEGSSVNKVAFGTKAPKATTAEILRHLRTTGAIDRVGNSVLTVWATKDACLALHVAPRRAKNKAWSAASADAKKANRKLQAERRAAAADEATDSFARPSKKTWNYEADLPLSPTTAASSVFTYRPTSDTNPDHDYQNDPHQANRPRSP